MEKVPHTRKKYLRTMHQAYEEIGKILEVSPSLLHDLDTVMAEKTGRKGIIEKVDEEREHLIKTTLNALNSGERSSAHIRGVLRKTIIAHEKEVLNFLEIIQGKDEFEKASTLVRKIATTKKGLFLKKEFIRKILEERKPEKLLGYLGVQSIREVAEKCDIVEAFSALRFIESNEWMHETFEKTYSNFTPDDFEEREIEVRVLSPIWYEIAKKFVEKKHHNVSHLKEFGIIFLNPIKEDVPGKFLRDFSLLLHYFHEIEFYSKLFRRYIRDADFSGKLKMLLRGDINRVDSVGAGEWLIVQRYLFKENPSDPRLFLPRVNPESLHWAKGEHDLTVSTVASAGDLRLDLSLWSNLHWVGCMCDENPETIISFDLEDNAMSLVSFMEGKEVNFNYHQREAMWTKIFMEYAGGQGEMERLLLENFDKGIVKF